MDAAPGRERWELPRFPGAIGISHLRVYDSEAPDGLRGGTPHVHSVCTEAYAVIRGTGSVQTLTMDGFRATPLEPGSLVWFTPGTIHRLVNDGDLEIFVLMANEGLPEAGDLVLTFPDTVLDDAGAYHDAATLPDAERTTAGTGGAARARRDLAVEGFATLRAALDAGDAAPLERFYRSAAAILAPRAPGWRSVWAAGPLRSAWLAGERIAAIGRGEVEHLRAASVQALPPPADERRMGCCGTLGTYLPLVP